MFFLNLQPISNEEYIIVVQNLQLQQQHQHHCLRWITKEKKCFVQGRRTFFQSYIPYQNNDAYDGGAATYKT